MDDLPAEVLATAFEMGVLAWGIHFLPPACLVCRTWNDIVTNTPHLWGIVDVDAKSRPRLLLDQISKAKAAPLSVFLGRGAHNRDRLEPVIDQLVLISHNWISAVVPAHILERCRWYDLRNKLQELSITQGALGPDSPFFERDGRDDLDLRVSPALCGFTMTGPNPPLRLLSPALKSFKFSPGLSEGIALSTTLDQLSRIPNLETLRISQLKHHSQLLDEKRIVCLKNLTSLTLDTVDNPSILLCSLACPALEVLTLGPLPRNYRWWDLPEYPTRSLIPFLSQWCNPEHTPTRLHTLTIEQCLAPGDMPYLIQFLARLPNIVRLTVHDDVLDNHMNERTDENDLFKALASLDAARSVGGGWICPVLRYLNIQPEAPIEDLVNIVQGRGIHSLAPGGLRTLRKVTGYLCRDGTAEEMAIVRSLVQDVECECLACGIGFIDLT